MSESTKTLKQLVNGTPFHVLFNGDEKARTTAVSSADLATAAGKNTTLYDVTLATLRTCGKLSKRFLFCIDSSNMTADTTTLGYYISLTMDNIAALKEADADSGDSPALIKVQYTSKYRRPDQTTKPPTTPATDDSNTGDGGGTGQGATDPMVVQTYGMVAEYGEGIESTHPATMTEQQWNYVMITNSLLHGLVYNSISSAIQIARQPAFKLKKSYFDPLDSPAGTTSDSDSTQSSGSSMFFSIPDFQVVDDASVTITEIKSTLQLSMAKHAFTSWSVEASASGGFDGISGGVTGSASSSSSSSTTSTQGSAQDSLHASYNFPRVKIFLDVDDLEVSDNCQTLLNAIKSDKKPVDVATFRRKYGHIFASSIQLGGRLHSTRDSSTFTDTDINAKMDAMKVAAGANFSSPFASGSASAAYSQGSGSQSSSTTGGGSAKLTWETQGGETLLGSNPPLWITTVGSYYNWRAIQRGDLQNILLVLQGITSDDWPTIFTNIDSSNTSSTSSSSSGSNGHRGYPE